MSLWKRRSAAVLVAVFVSGWLVADADARPFRPGKLPNLPNESDLRNGDVCTTCHTTFGGSPRNPFGLDVQARVTPNGQEVFWGLELAALDSDGDGFTNGEELGDPDGTWQEGDAAPGDPAAITHPGDPDSHPPEPEPTAVEGSSWGKIKNLVQGLLK